MPYGTPGPMVARFPDSEPRTPPRNRNCRAYQLADDPESAVTMASAGSRADKFAEDQHRVDRIGRYLGLGVHRPPPADHARLDGLAPGTIFLALQVRDQGGQRGGRVPDQVDLVRIPHPDELAVDVDLDAAGLAELGQELRVREARAHGEQRVAVLHHLVAG